MLTHISHASHRNLVVEACCAGRSIVKLWCCEHNQLRSLASAQANSDNLKKALDLKALGDSKMLAQSSALIGGGVSLVALRHLYSCLQSMSILSEAKPPTSPYLWFPSLEL